MSDLSKQISELAEKYDPDREADARASLKLIQGALCASSNKLRPFIKIDEIDQPVDPQGNYEDYFVISTGAGHRIRVTLEVEA